MRKYTYHILKCDLVDAFLDDPAVYQLEKVEGYLVETGWGTVPICVRKKDNGWWTADDCTTGRSIDSKSFKSRAKAVDHVLQIADKVNAFANEKPHAGEQANTYHKLENIMLEVMKRYQAVNG